MHAAAGLLRDHWPAIRFSSVYRTAPVGYTDQPDFLNAVAGFESDETTADVLSRLQQIERQLGKATPFKDGPRTIDLDLLLYGDVMLNEPGLQLPHPRMGERRFVLEPLTELLPEDTGYSELLATVKDQELEKTEIVL